MNLGTLLQQAGDLSDLAPRQSPDALARQTRFANLALTELLNKAPYLMPRDERRFDVPGTLIPLAGETLDVDGDAWVLVLDTADAAAIAQWRLDGTHATQSIYLVGADGERIRRIIQGVANIGGVIYVSITEPWPNTTDTGLNWEVRTDDFLYPKDLKAIDTLRLSNAANTWFRDINLIGVTEGRRYGGLNRGSSGQPWIAYPGGNWDIPAPDAPTAALVNSATAFDDYPVDTFEYTVSLAWGTRPEGLPRPSAGASTAARLAPLVESERTAPVTATPVEGSLAVQLTLPDIRVTLAMTAGTRSDPDLVGYYLCIYRAAEGRQPKLWTTVPAGTLAVTDDGTITPDFFRPPPRDAGCKSVTFDTIPGEQIIVDGVWAPPTLVHASDALQVDETGGQTLVELTAERICRKLNDAAGAAGARARFEAMLSDLSNEQSTGQDPARPIRRGTRRVGGSHRANRFTVDYDVGN